MIADGNNISLDSGIELSDSEFDRISVFLETAVGIFMPVSNKALVYSRISGRVRSLGFESFSDYLEEALVSENRAEVSWLISALTTNTTRFFREPYHFSLFEEVCLPRLIELSRRGGRVRLWSAACSTGEEVYSLAGVTLRSFPDVGDFDFRILATDIDEGALSSALSGKYKSASVESVPHDLRDVIFEPSNADAGIRKVRRSLRDIISFRKLNLVGEWPKFQGFDFVLCRNALIYMSANTQDLIWKKISSVVNPGGVLCVGHSERLFGSSLSEFRSIGKTAYEKILIGGCEK